MEKMNASIRERDNEHETDKSADDELDEPAFVFFGLDFQFR